MTTKLRKFSSINEKGKASGITAAGLPVQTEVKAMETWMSILTDFGFPAMVTFYLLHRVEGKMNLLIESIHGLPERLNHPGRS